MDLTLTDQRLAALTDTDRAPTSDAVVAGGDSAVRWHPAMRRQRARLATDPATYLVPAGLAASAALTWVQHRWVLGDASVPLLAYVLPACVGVALGAVMAWLVVGRRSAESRASTDALTRIKNRAATERSLADEVERSARYGGAFSVLVFDVDHFKTINDTHGHGAGDGVLMHLAETVSGTIRRSDVFGRWGGDEFVLIAPGVPLTGGRALAEKLRAAIADTPAPGDIRATISVGVSHYVKGDTTESLLRRADEALYEAKRGGRNRAASTRCLRSTGSHRVIEG